MILCHVEGERPEISNEVSEGRKWLWQTHIMKHYFLCRSEFGGTWHPQICSESEVG